MRCPSGPRADQDLAIDVRGNLWMPWPANLRRDQVGRPLLGPARHGAIRLTGAGDSDSEKKKWAD
eukprot:2468562-Pyramimonas_sp.AAC.1